MNNLAIKIISKPKARRMVIEMDRERFERVAASLGFFGQDFLKSLDQAEKDVRAGRIRSIKSLKELDL